MTKIKVSEATGPSLDWLVALCEGYTDWCGETEKFLAPRKGYGWVSLCDLNYSTYWDLGGPLLEWASIGVARYGEGGTWAAVADTAFTRGGKNKQTGPTPLIAAMRCFVVSKLGEEVEVPDELLEI